MPPALLASATTAPVSPAGVRSPSTWLLPLILLVGLLLVGQQLRTTQALLLSPRTAMPTAVAVPAPLPAVPGFAAYSSGMRWPGAQLGE